MILASFGNLFRIPELRTKLLYTAFFLIIFRIGSQIPIPGIQLDVLQRLQDQLGGGALGGMLTLFSTLTGGSIGNCAIFSLGIMPYISASIIFSLLTKVIPALEALSKEGASGYRRINEYTRYATVPLCIIEAFMIVKLFKRPIAEGSYLVPDPSPGFHYFDFVAIITLTAGAVFLMWLGEQISEFGIGNGISMLIMAGIVARMPHQIELMAKGEGGTEIKKFVVMIALFVIIIGAVIYMTYGMRKITVQQAKHTKGRRVYGGQKHSMPLRVNQSGVMPVIFASSLLVFPMTIASMFGATRDDMGGWFGWGSFSYVASYVLLVYFFSYFWTSLMFQPVEMANQLKEYGSFIPGIRPGVKTASYLERVMTRITFVGAAFLALIALTPLIITMALNLQSSPGASFVYNLGGTSILIIVGVILDIVQKLESHLLMRHYEGFVKKGRMRGR